AESPEVERYHTRSVRAVHQRVDASRRELVDEPLDRQDESRPARDVGDEREARPGGHASAHPVPDPFRVRHRGRQGPGHHDARPPAASSALRHALYVWSVATTSSPGPNSSERRTVFTPVVAFGTKARSSAGAPRKAPSAWRAPSRRPSSSRLRKRTGSSSNR